MAVGFFILLLTLPASARRVELFDSGWLFSLNPSGDQQSVGVADAGWRHLDLPHDWAIEGDFSASAPSGAGGGALPGGTGWYRKHFNVSDLGSGKRVWIAFDGVYMNSTVYVNGQQVGNRPYGYSSFEYDLTPYLHEGNNVVAVKVDNSDQPNSRWYSGCGIYRHVWLTETNPLHIKRNSTQVLTDEKGNVTISMKYADENDSGTKPVIRHTITDQKGRVVATSKGTATAQKLKVRKPHLWNIGDGYVYTVKSELVVNGQTLDEQAATIGFRSIRFDTQGFWLNGRNVKLNGVCEHHDLGALGAAFNEDAMHRKLLKLRQMGVNALRCSHNPPAPEVLNMCDTMGIVVVDESFDMWRRKKSQRDYARFFDEWHERDLADLVRRDRNHPSIIAWSIGNEVLEQWSSADADELTLEQANLILNAGHEVVASDNTHPNAMLTQHLANLVKASDPSRPITAGCNEPSPDNHLFKSGAIDLIGFNYHHEWVKDVPQNFPGKPFYMSESVSALQTRGYYPQLGDTIIMVPERWDIPYTHPSMMCSAYDNMHTPWSSTHEQTWNVVKHTPYCFGQFIWTGFDYIGEPTPYQFPARSSYFGIIDLAGMPKDVYYMYQSEWTSTPVLHLFPHWNWMPGQTIDMWCYYNGADEVELYVNGRSQGVRRKTSAGPENERYTLPLNINREATEFHVAWQVVYEPGEVRVVARKDGQEVAEQTIRTAGAPHHIRLTVDYDGRQYNVSTLNGVAKAKGKDRVYVMAEVVDKDNNLCPNAENELFFSVDGGAIAGVDNGCPFSMERFQADHRKAFFGKCMLIATPDHTAPLTVTARGVDLQEATITAK